MSYRGLFARGLGTDQTDGLFGRGVFTDSEAGGSGLAGDLTAVSRHVRSFGSTARLIRGLRIIAFLALGAL